MARERSTDKMYEDKHFNFNSCIFLLMCTFNLGQIFALAIGGSDAQLLFKCKLKSESIYGKILNN